ncbi:unnamed protein product [Cyclocybe aegerita]|uniref:Uncharacterized protein n=1 Tax=Cyclocybe aegerita TaxID=1973307 RepID=A0A8S0W6T2_CYCAE|nr:unnamed protein product [Cyclocybe aegerita]
MLNQHQAEQIDTDSPEYKLDKEGEEGVKELWEVVLRIGGIPCPYVEANGTFRSELRLSSEAFRCFKNLMEVLAAQLLHKRSQYDGRFPRGSPVPASEIAKYIQENLKFSFATRFASPSDERCMNASLTPQEMMDLGRQQQQRSTRNAERSSPEPEEDDGDVEMESEEEGVEVGFGEDDDSGDSDSDDDGIHSK